MTKERATIQKARHEKDYVVLGNEMVQNKALSWKARGLLVYILSLPKHWKLYVSELANHATDGVDGTRTGFKELKKAGYVTGGRARGDDGTFYWRYEASEYPAPAPHGEIPYMDNPDGAKPDGEKPTLESTHADSTDLESTHEGGPAFSDLWDGEKEPPITIGEKTPGDPLEAVHAHAKKKAQLDNTRPKEWRNTSDGAYGLCRRFADLFRDGALPWSDGDIEKSIATAERMIIHFGGDARKAKRVLDEFHADCDGDPGHGCTTLFSLRNRLPTFASDQKKKGAGKGDRTEVRNGKKVTVLRQ